MRSLSEIVATAGYTVISNNSPTCLEVAGNGEWAPLENACRRFVKRGYSGHAIDHVTVVVRHGDGTRDLRDVGVNSVRFGYLPGVGFKWKRTYDGCGVKGARKDGKRYRCQMTVRGVKLYLGMFDTAKAAGMRRDRYVVDHNLAVKLNYPDEILEPLECALARACGVTQ